MSPQETFYDYYRAMRGRDDAAWMLKRWLLEPGCYVVSTPVVFGLFRALTSAVLYVEFLAGWMPALFEFRIFDRYDIVTFERGDGRLRRYSVGRLRRLIEHGKETKG
jgi:hypothetical protein